MSSPDSLKNVLLLKNCSIKIKMALALSALFVVAATARTFIALGYLETASKQMVVNQQNVLAKSIAEDLDQKLHIAQQALRAAASQVTPAMLADPERGRRFLLDKRPLLSIFTNQLLLIAADGKTVAELPAKPLPLGADPAHRPYFLRTVSSRQPQITTLTERQPLVVLTVPAFDRRGRLSGVLAGSVTLGASTFLGDLPGMSIGNKGFAFLVTTDGVIIAHPNRDRILESPAEGARKLFREAVNGLDGSGETVDSRGIPMLTSFHHLRSADWILGLNFPTEEALGMARHMKPILAAGIAAGTVVVLCLAWLIMQRLTAPFRSLTAEVEAMGEGSTLKPLQCGDSSYEISTLTAAFNRLIDTVRNQQEILQANEKKYRVVSDNSYDWQFWVSPEGCFIYSSPSGKRITGYDPKEFLNDPDLLQRIIHPEDGELFLEYRSQLPGPMREVQWRIVRKDGAIRWVSHLCQPIYNDTGTYLGMRGNNRDITEQKRVEAELQQSEERYRILVESSPDAVLLHRDGAFIFANAAAARLLGAATPAQLVGMRVMSTVHPDFRQEVAGRVDQVLHGSSTPFREQKVLRLDGTAIEVEAVGTSLTYQGRRAVQVILRDITARKQAERELRLSEQTLRNLMDVMPVGVLLVGNDQSIDYVNRSFERSFGYSSADIPTVGDWYRLAYPDVAYRETLVPDCDADLAKAKAKGTPVVPVEVEVTCKDGSLRHAIANRQLSGDRRIVIFTDITERELLQSELLKAQKLESLGVLAGGIAHDFNNILTGILGNISFARMFLDESHRAFIPLGHAEKASLRAAELATQLLTFAKGGAPVKKCLALAPLVEESVSLALRGTNVKVAIRLSAPLPMVEADEGQLSQVFHNIVLNAVQAMPEGGELTVSGDGVTLRPANPEALPPGSYVMLSFADQGHGMSSELQQKIFDPYFTTKPAGCGLGLASVHSIIGKHGGRVKVASAPGKGTLFTILLPSVQTAAVAPGPGTSSAAVPSGSGEPVLVMDDEPLILDFARQLLEHLGYRVITCSSGEQAVTLHEEAREAGTPFLVAIMDLTVRGGMGGKEAARRILTGAPAARLVVSSGYSSDPVLADYRDHGFCAAVAKPYKGPELAQVLAALQS